MTFWPPSDGWSATRIEEEIVVTLTLSCDHRVVDGARAAEFMRDLVTALQQSVRT